MIALRELFGLKRTGRFNLRRSPTEVHFHVDPTTVFGDNPIFIADGDLCDQPVVKTSTAKAQDMTRLLIKRPNGDFGFSGPTGSIYAQLLAPFANVFCFFCEDLGGLKRVSRHLAAWLEHDCPSTLPEGTRPRVVVVTEKRSGGAEGEREARKDLLTLIGKSTARNILEHISSIEVIELFPDGSLSTEARYRPLKERLINGSDLAREQRREAQLLFSATHLTALLERACEHFCDTLGEPFDFIKSSRAHNPVAIDLEDYLSSFLALIKSPIQLTTLAAPTMASSFFIDSYPPDSHYFAPKEIFSLLYEDHLKNACGHRVMKFEESNSVVLRSGFLDLVRKHFEHYAQLTTHGSKLPAEIHIENLDRSRSHWQDVYSNSVCLACLRRMPIYDLPCGHVICGNCVSVFGEESKKEPYLFFVRRCFLCQVVMPKDLCIRMHPPTAGAGIICIDGGGIRGIMPLQIIKRIKDRINLPIPFQRFIKVAFGISSGGLIVADLFINGSSVEESSEKFEALAKNIFQRRVLPNVPFMPKVLRNMLPLVADCLHPLPSLLYLADILVSYFNDGLYASSNIETALKRVFGANRSILDISSATFTGTLIGLPVATANDKPTCRIFSNYNCKVEQTSHDGMLVAMELGSCDYGKLHKRYLLPKVFRVFPAKHIHGFGTFQDAGPLENDPLISALTAAAKAFPLLEEPDFIVSLGTGEPKPQGEFPVTNSRNTWKNGALPRLLRLAIEKMRDKKLRQAYQGHPKYHRLNVQFDEDEPRLDDVHSIAELRELRGTMQYQWIAPLGRATHTAAGVQSSVWSTGPQKKKKHQAIRKFNEEEMQDYQ
ncbi:uncharacterized protein FFNC_10015 [Fusarium fujikuroi]|nr:uncharacterized protein FFE2_08910 [Fusarium fujikuroi]SCO44745.1 uncharacterized protein FFNC_10015 [Fusarium fujikuroi]